MEKEGRKCLLIKGDLEAEAHCLEVVQKTVDEYGRIDVLINNAAFQVSKVQPRKQTRKAQACTGGVVLQEEVTDSGRQR